jgi:UDP-glucose 4-epimerase
MRTIVSALTTAYKMPCINVLLGARPWFVRPVEVFGHRQTTVEYLDPAEGRKGGEREVCRTAYGVRMRVLVSGGAGYIGSHTVVQLAAAGHDVVIVDSFANAKPTVVGRLESLTGTHLEVHGFDLTDKDKTERLFAAEKFDAVIHFAGLKAVGESVQIPLDYYVNNLESTFSLLQAMRRHGCDLLVFSSSATVYGEVAPVPYQEDYEPLSASSPYGRTKVMIEHVLRDVAAIDERLKVAILRYFNPVGAHPSGTIGEDPQGIPNNLMPFVAQVAVGRRERLQVFGGDYPTADGTAERDYIHVEDLAAGHVAALQWIAGHDRKISTWNLGGGIGTSVLQVIAAFEKASGRPIPYDVVGRRAGDLPAYWADPSRAHEELRWRAERSIDDMCADTWRWQSANPGGYPQ